MPTAMNNSVTSANDNGTGTNADASKNNWGAQDRTKQSAATKLTQNTEGN
jgi:hypothetical protein